MASRLDTVIASSNALAAKSLLQRVDFAVPGVRAGFTCRSGGLSHAPYGSAHGQDGGLNLALHVGDDADVVLANRQRLQQELNPSISAAKSTLDSSMATRPICQPLWLNQVHGVNVLDATQAIHQPLQGADASFSQTPGIACCVMTADCLPVLFCDAEGQVVAAAHAGWRGLAAGVLQLTVQAMRQRGATKIHAWLGPAIGPQHFEVGEEVRQAFQQHFASDLIASAFHATSAQKYLADIFILARAALQQSGVEVIFGGGVCTVSQSTDFYSYRRDKVTGRMASLIWLEG